MLINYFYLIYYLLFFNLIYLSSFVLHTCSKTEQTGMFVTQGMMCQCESIQEVRYQGMWYRNQETGARYPGTVMLGTQESGTMVLGTQGSFW